MKTYSNKLKQFIDSHCGCKCISVSDDKLTVQSEVVFADRTVHTVTETIDATFTAVREWLGY